MGHFCPPWILIRIRTVKPDPDPGAPLNPNPIRIWIRNTDLDNVLYIGTCSIGSGGCQKKVVDVHIHLFHTLCPPNATI
jgi:hypothetical protein